MEQKHKIIEMITKTLDNLSEFQQAYDGYVNLLIFRINELEPIEWNDTYNSMTLARDLKMVSSDLNNNYKKYTMRYTKKLEALNRPNAALQTYTVIDTLNQITKLRQNLARGILGRDYKNLLESYNSVINTINISLKTHKRLTKVKKTTLPVAKTVLQPHEVYDLTKSIGLLKHSIDLLLDGVDEANPKTTTELETSDIAMAEEEVRLFPDEEPTAEWDVSEFNDVPVPDISLQYYRIEELLLELQANQYNPPPTQEVPLTEIMDRIEDFERNIITKLATLNEPGGMTYIEEEVDEVMDEGFKAQDAIDIKKGITEIKQAVSTIYNNTELLGQNLETFSAAHMTELPGYIKNTINQAFGSRLQDILGSFLDVINKLNLVNSTDLQHMQSVIIEKILTSIKYNLINEENITEILNEPFKRLEGHHAKSVTDLVRVITNEFNTYMANLQFELKQNVDSSKVNNEKLRQGLEQQELLLVTHKKELSAQLKQQTDTVQGIAQNFTREFDKYTKELARQQTKREETEMHFSKFLSQTVPGIIDTAVTTITDEGKSLKDIHLELETTYGLLQESTVHTNETLAKYEANIKAFEGRFNRIIKNLKRDELKLNEIKTDIANNNTRLEQTLKTSHADIMKGVKEETYESFKTLIHNAYAELKGHITRISEGDTALISKIPSILQKLQVKENETLNMSKSTHKLLQQEKEKIKHIEEELSEITNKLNDTGTVNKRVMRELQNISMMVEDYQEPVGKKRKRIE